MLNKNQISTLISLIHRCSQNIEGFTIRNSSDLEKQWALASQKCTEASFEVFILGNTDSESPQFKRFDVVVPYQRINQTFEMYARPLWKWTLDIVQDPQLADFFVWDAEKAYFFNGTKYVRFYTEPWTAKAMWEIQVIS
jgi:hypothetical protein